MGLLSVDVSNPDLLKKRSFDPVPAGTYVCEVENDLVVAASKSSDNQIVKLELRIIDDGEYKGRKIFDNLIIGSTPEVKAKTEWKIAQFAIACGVCTKDTLNEIDLKMFKGTTCNVKVGVKTEAYQGETKAKNVVQEYLFDREA